MINESRVPKNEENHFEYESSTIEPPLAPDNDSSVAHQHQIGFFSNQCDHKIKARFVSGIEVSDRFWF